MRGALVVVLAMSHVSGQSFADEGLGDIPSGEREGGEGGGGGGGWKEGEGEGVKEGMSE